MPLCSGVVRRLQSEIAKTTLSPPAGLVACIQAPEEATMFVPRHASDAAATGPRLREVTIQYTLKRGVGVLDSACREFR